MLKESIDSLNHEKLELSIQAARLTTQTNFQQERYDLLVANTDGQSKELAVLRDKLSTAASTLTRQESKVQELTVSLSEARQTLEIVKNENQQMKIDREVWKATEARTIKERQDLVRERNSAIDRLREVQHQFDDRDRLSTAERKRLENQLESVQKEMQSTRKQLSDLMDEHRSMTARHDLQSKESQSKIESLSTSLEKTKGELSLSQNKEANLNEKLHELNSRFKNAEDKLSIYEGRARLLSQAAESSPEDRVKTYELKLSQAKHEIVGLKEELKAEKEHSITYKDIAQASEERLSELNATYDLYKAETEKELSESKLMVSALKQEKDEIKERLNSTIQELTSSEEKLDAQRMQYTQEIKDLGLQLENARSSESAALAQFETLRADVQVHSKLARDSQDNYEREVLAHSVSLKSLTSIKEEAISLRNQLAESEQKLFVSERAWNSSKASWELSKTEYENQFEELKTRCNDLTVQNTLLHSQFEQIQSAQRKVSDRVFTEIADVTSSDKSQEELREVIRFLRREKDILQTKLELSLQESERATVQLEHLQKSLDETRAMLDEVYFLILILRSDQENLIIFWLRKNTKNCWKK
jgi:nucleoprotein TPR